MIDENEDSPTESSEISAEAGKTVETPPPNAKSTASAEAKEEAKRRRRRSNRPYPPSSFDEALEFARAIYEFNSGLPVRKLTFFDHLGRSPESSSSRDAITNANKYGLIKGSFAADQLELTADGLAIVADNVSPREQARAKIKLAVENIDPFRQLYEKLAGSRLPVKSALIDGMKELGVSEDSAEEATDLFIINLRAVGLLQVLSGADRIVSIDHLLDNLPSAEANTRDRAPPFVAPSPKGPAPEPRSAGTPEMAGLESTCFYVTPIGSAGSDVRKHSDLFLGSIVEPAMTSLGLKVVRADTIGQPGIITRQILEFILRSRLVVADLSFHNPNVFYELAIRHAARLPIVQIVRQSDSIPFDINQMRTIQIDDNSIYNFVPNLEVYRAEIATQARRALEPEHEVDTPISVYFPTLRTSIS